VLTGFRQAVFHAVPVELKTAISVGIGLILMIVLMTRKVRGAILISIMLADSIAAAAGGAAGISSNTSYIESAAGVGDGARTGLASVVTGIAFLLATFLSPLVAVVPYEAASPALVIVGFLMMMQVSGISWKDYEIAIPAFLTIILMPFTYSITVGIGAGFVSFVVIKIAVGKIREIHPLMWITGGLFVVYFALAPIKTLLGV
jgi:adenine/guanine/hypoxanthine permease